MFKSMGFSCMKENGFQSALGGSLKMDGTFSHLSKFVCLKATESKWAFSVVSRSCNHIFLQSLVLNKDGS